jgi:type II secretory pathway component PulC
MPEAQAPEARAQQAGGGRSRRARVLRGAALLAALGGFAFASVDLVRVEPAPAPELPPREPPPQAVRPPAASAVRARPALPAPLDARATAAGGAPGALAAAHRTVETAPGLRLLGTVIAADPASSLAVIEDAAIPRVHVVHPGTRIGELLVERIAPGWVEGTLHGRLVRVAFASTSPRAAEPTPEEAPAEPEPEALVAAARPARERPQPVAPAARAAQDDDDLAPAAWMDSLEVRTALAELGPRHAAALFDLSRQADFSPQFGEGGALHGIQIGDVRPGSTLERVGLQRGDLVVAVNGTAVRSVSSLASLRGVALENGFPIDVIRAGMPTTLRVPAGEL